MANSAAQGAGKLRTRAGNAAEQKRLFAQQEKELAALAVRVTRIKDAERRVIEQARLWADSMHNFYDKEALIDAVRALEAALKGEKDA